MEKREGFNMTKKRFTIKQQDDYFGVVDNNTTDKTCVVNGIRTEIEAEWLCDSMNKLNDENEQLKFDMTDCAKRYRKLFNKYIKLLKENKETEYNPSYPKRNPITYNAVPEAIYNWDD